jgi:hypothetical protein
LVAKRLSSPGGHDREHILPVQDLSDDGLLILPERFKTEDGAEDLTHCDVTDRRLKGHEL